MEWIGLVKIVSGLLGLLVVFGTYSWVYRQGYGKGYQKGVKASEGQWEAEKLRFYADLQKRASIIKSSKAGAKIV